MFKMHIRRIVKNERGGVLIWVALVLTILVAMAGIAIDYSRVYEVKSQLQHAADAAALAAATAPSEEKADEALTAYASANTTVYVQGLNMKPVLTSWQTGRAQVSITATVPLTLSTLLGAGDIPVGVSSTAARGFTYFDTYVAVDMSGSLGIAADAANIARLQALTQPYVPLHANPSGQGCAFACHGTDGWEPWQDAQGNRMTTYDFARLNNIDVREDVLKAAFQDFVSAYFAGGGQNATQRRMDVIGFSGPFDGSPLDADKWILDLTDGPVSDITTAQNALGKYPNSLKAATLFEFALPVISGRMGQQGTGSSQASPKKMLILITDGARSGRYGSLIWPIDEPLSESGPSQNNCQAIKDKDITLAVINVKYVSLAGDTWFDLYFQTPRTLSMPDGSVVNTTIYPQLSSALQQCASPGWYFEAADGGHSGIEAAMTQLLDSINKTSLRLAN
jgi:hypothetical protein